MRLRQALAPVVDLVFPPRCPLCGEAVSEQHTLCAACWTTLAIPGTPACRLCQRPFPPEAAVEEVCAPCQSHPPRHDGIAAATLYNPASRQLVLGFKHGGRIALAPLLARLMLPKLRGIDGGWLLVPVPLHRWRLWSRGYNQAALLARELARMTGAHHAVDALHRHRQTPRLGGLDRVQRAEALVDAIRINPRVAERLRGARVVLVDDVLTSGATTDACIAALRRAGAREVRIACFARVADDALPHI